MRGVGGGDLVGVFDLGCEYRVPKGTDLLLQGTQIRGLAAGRHQSEGYGSMMNGH
jgi:hypothetical protein